MGWVNYVKRARGGQLFNWLKKNLNYFEINWKSIKSHTPHHLAYDLKS